MLSVYRFCMCFTPKYWDSGQASISLQCIFTKAEFGEWHRFTGIKAYFVWPITYPWKRHDKIWSPLPPVEGRPLRRLHTSACRAPAHRPGIYWLQEEASAFHSTPVLSPPSPDTFPFEVVMLGITGFTLPLPFPEVPSSLRFSIYLTMWKSTICHHHPCDSPPPDCHRLIWVPALVTCFVTQVRRWWSNLTLTRGGVHVMTEQCSCCFLCYSSCLWVDSHDTLGPYLGSCFLTEACCTPLSITEVNQFLFHVRPLKL